VAQWTLEMNHVTPLVGGFLSQQRHIGQEGVRFTPVPRARQAAATQFLLAHAFVTPAFLVQPELLRRIEAAGVLNRIRNAQSAVMNALLQTDRLARLVEQSAVDGAAAYTPVQFLRELRSGIWSELATPARPIDPFRRNTHRVYLDTIDARLHGGVEPEAEVRALLRGELRALRGQLGVAIPLVTDRASRLHLEDARDQIDEMLDPRAMRQRTTAGRAGGPGAPGFDFDNDPFQQAPDGCWPDYTF
jgi:hypothetical protein